MAALHPGSRAARGLCLLALSLLLGACGQKGPLTLPKDAATKPAPAASATARP